MTSTAQEPAGGVPAYPVTAIAQAAHELNRVLQLAENDPHPSPHWEDLAAAEQEAAAGDVEGTLAILRDARWDISRAAEAEWKRWSAAKRAAGWTPGPVKDSVAKTHPCLAGNYADLPLRQQEKDYARLSLIRSMSGEGW